MDGSSRGILLALTCVLCLLGRGFGASLPLADRDDDEVDLMPSIPIDQMLINASKHADKNASPMYFSEHTHLVRRELDMVYTMDEWLNIRHRNRQRRTAAIRPNEDEKRWTDKIVNYEIERDVFSRRHQKEIYRAIRDLSHFTCLKFRQTSIRRNRIQIQRGFGGCYSRVGMVGGPQELGIGRYCEYKHIIIHELCHAIGIHHEQTRPDRDDHVTLRLDHVPERMHHNFDKYDWDYINNHSLAYDYLSIMHYGKTAFTTSGENTIVTHDEKYQDLIGKNRQLSVGDIRTLNAMYECVPEKCNLTEEYCGQMGGFVGKDCKCWCPGEEPLKSSVEYCSKKDIEENGSLTNACRDLDPDCPEYKESGLCNHDDYWDYMFPYCAGSCGMC